MRRLLIAFLVLVALTVAILYARRDGNAEPVEVGVVSRRDVLRSYVTASGEIVAMRFADVGSSVMGRVVELLVQEGQRVQSGQVLARIDAVQAQSDAQAAAQQIAALEADEVGARDQVAMARSELDSATARAREAAQVLERAKQLSAAGLLPAAEQDAAVAAADAANAQARAATAAIARAEQTLMAAGRRVAQARAQAVRAQDVLSKTSITAPIGGVVTRLQVREGEMVVVGIQNQPGTTLMTISDLSGVNAEVKVAEADVLRLRLGLPATVSLDAVSGASYAGRIVEIGASALPVQGVGAAAREFRVVIRLDGETSTLRPGLTCDAEILAEERQNALTVPLQAVVLRSPAAGQPETTGVFVVRSGEAVFAPVTTGVIGGLDIEVSGLDAETPVIVGPFTLLRTLQSGTRVLSR